MCCSSLEHYNDLIPATLFPKRKVCAVFKVVNGKLLNVMTPSVTKKTGSCDGDGEVRVPHAVRAGTDKDRGGPQVRDENRLAYRTVHRRRDRKAQAKVL